MRSPRYLYRASIFIFSLKIGLFALLLWTFSIELIAESYASYTFDDFAAQNDWGRVKVTTKTRTEAFSKDYAPGFHSFYQIFTGGNFRSQKGGTDKDEAGKYAFSGSGNSEVNLIYKSGIQTVSFSLGPRLQSRESRVYDRERTSVWDAEGIVSYAMNLHPLKLSLEGGRGWQRLDGFGFLFNGMANFGQFQIKSNESLSISIQSLNFKPDEESLKPSAWNHKRKELVGIALRSQEILFWENLQFYFYRYDEPNMAKQSSNFESTNQYGSFSYTGLEFRSMKFWNEANIDLAIIRVIGERKIKSAPWTENSFATNATLAYSAIHGLYSNFFWSFGGLYTSKDNTNRTDSNSNGFAAPVAEPRVLGGYSSFLLYQSVYFPNDRIFYEFSEKGKPGFENKGMRMFGLQWGMNLFTNLRGDLYLNRSSSEMGNGTEFILKLTQKFENSLNGFTSASFCYAKVDSNQKITYISEPFSELEKQKEFIRVYISAGFQF